MHSHTRTRVNLSILAVAANVSFLLRESQKGSRAVFSYSTRMEEYSRLVHLDFDLKSKHTINCPQLPQRREFKQSRGRPTFFTLGSINSRFIYYLLVPVPNKVKDSPFADML